MNIGTTISTILGAAALGSLLWKGYSNLADTFGHLATKEDIARVERRIDILSGEDQMLRLRAGYSYVREPVTRGENIYLHMVAQRTTYGLACEYTGSVPLFTDRRNVPIPGKTVSPPVQVGRDWVPLITEVSPPPELLSGHIQVVLQLSYNCEGKFQTQTTQPFRYIL